MHSDRKKLGEFNQIPQSELKGDYEHKYKSERKYQER